MMSFFYFILLSVLMFCEFLNFNHIHTLVISLSITHIAVSWSLKLIERDEFDFFTLMIDYLFVRYVHPSDRCTIITSYVLSVYDPVSIQISGCSTPHLLVQFWLFPFSMNWLLLFLLHIYLQLFLSYIWYSSLPFSLSIIHRYPPSWMVCYD